MAWLTIPLLGAGTGWGCCIRHTGYQAVQQAMQVYLAPHVDSSAR